MTRVRWLLAVALSGLSLSGAAGAVAEPPGEPPPAPPPAPAPPVLPGLAGIGNVLAQSGSAAAGPLGLPDFSMLDPGALLAQHAAPTSPDPAAPATVPGLSAFDPAYLIPLNLTPAAPGSGELAPGIGPDADIPGTGRIAFLRRLHEMYAAGQLDGALLGQRPPEPAPGTVPPAPPAG